MYVGKVGRVLLFLSWDCLAAGSSPAAAGAPTCCLHSPAAWPGPAVPTKGLPWSWWVLCYGHTAKVSQQGTKRLLDLEKKM